MNEQRKAKLVSLVGEKKTKEILQTIEKSLEAGDKIRTAFLAQHQMTEDEIGHSSIYYQNLAEITIAFILEHKSCLDVKGLQKAIMLALTGRPLIELSSLNASVQIDQN